MSTLLLRIASHEKNKTANTETSIVIGCLNADLINFIVLFGASILFRSRKFHAKKTKSKDAKSIGFLCVIFLCVFA
jgi:hypothetical protein